MLKWMNAVVALVLDSLFPYSYFVNSTVDNAAVEYWPEYEPVACH